MFHRCIVDLTNNNLDALSFIKRSLYLKETINCPRFHTSIDTIVSSQSLDGFIFNCKNYRKTTSVRKASFLEFFKITMVQFIDFTYFFFESSLNIYDLNHK